MNPVFAEDSTPMTLAPILRQLVETLDEKSSRHDYVIAFLIVIMAETGYRVSSLYNQTERSWNKEKTCIPDNWKSEINGFYEITFLQFEYPDLRFKLIGIPLGHTLLLNLIPLIPNTKCKVQSTVINSSKYINIHTEDLNFKFWNVKELALRFKNDMSAPLHAHMMLEQGMVSPCLQGLPQEIKIYIMHFLKTYSIAMLRSACKEFDDIPLHKCTRNTVRNKRH